MARVVMVVTNPVIADPRVEKEAAVLATAGYEVVVIAWDRHGESAPIEVRDGFRIERIGPRATFGGGWRSLPAFRAFWRLATDRARSLAPDVIHCHDLDTAVVGLRIRRESEGRTRLVVDLHEFYRASRMVPQEGLVGALARFLVGAFERRACRAADLVVLVTPAMLPLYEPLGIAERIVLVENAPDAERFVPSAADARPKRPFTVGYIGQKRYTESLMVLIDIVQRHEDMAAFLAGGGVAAAAIDEAASRAQRVTTVGRYTYAEQPALYEQCDAVYAVYDARVGNIRLAFPVKVMEAMACGLPVVVNADTWIGAFVERHGVGLAVDGSDPAAVEAALVRLKDDPDLRAEMGRRGRALVEGGLSWQAASARLLDAYARLLSA